MRGLAVGPEAALVAFGQGRAVAVWDGRTGAVVSELHGHTGDVTAVAFSRDGRLLASAGEDGVVRTWDVATAREVGKLEGHAGTAHTAPRLEDDAPSKASAAAA